jgi:glucosamine-6-phosphate deaminase
MSRPLSKIAPDWWDYTTLDRPILQVAAKLDEKDMVQLARPGFQIHFYDTLEKFYLTEAMEYVEAWRQGTADNPAGICGPIGPTEQLPLVARIVDSLGINLRHAHFWGMDEWTENGQPVLPTHPLSFARTDRELCFYRIHPQLRMHDSHMHFPTGDIGAYSKIFDSVRCVVMQGGQGEVKHWAFNDPPRRTGAFTSQAPSPAEYRQLGTRQTDLHPLTIVQNARTSSGGNVAMVPSQNGRPGGDLESGKSFHLASRSSRQSLWHAAHGADDSQAAGGYCGAHVAAGGPSQCSFPLLPPWPKTCQHRDALR